MKKALYILLIVLLVAAMAFLVKDYRKGKLALDNVIQSKENVVKGDSQGNNQESLKLFELAAEHLKDDASLKLRILYTKWPKIEKLYSELARAVMVQREDVIGFEKKLEVLKSLVEEVEQGVEEVLALENLTSEEEWRAHNLMGCVKLWKTLFVQGNNQEDINKRIQGILREAIHSFKQSINVVEKHNLIGISTDTPRRNLELLLKRNENRKQQPSDSQEGDAQDKKKILKKVMPILGSPGETGGEK